MDILLDRTLAVKVNVVTLSDIIKKLVQCIKAKILLRINICSSTLNKDLEFILQMLLIRIVLTQRSVKCLFMRKCKLVCNVMHDLACSSPEHTVIVFYQTVLYQTADLSLYLVKGAKIFMSLGYKGWLDVRKDISETKCFSM